MAKDQLTAKQMLFARLYSSGQYSKIEAYEEAGYMPNGKRESRRVESQKLAKRPHVAQAIAAYQAELLPLDEIKAEKQNALRSIKTLAFGAKDERVRLASARALYELCDEREKFESVNGYRRTEPADIDRVVGELLKLGQAGTEAFNSLELEEVDEVSSMDHRESEEEQ
jgi:phage terminase small subunit